MGTKDFKTKLCQLLDLLCLIEHEEQQEEQDER